MTDKRASDTEWAALQGRIMGLGENSIRKNHYPELKARIQELERIRSLLNMSNDFFFVIDVDTMSITDWNISAKDALGYEAAPTFDLIDTGAGLDALNTVKSCSKGSKCCKQSQSLISSFMRHDGSQFPVEITISYEDTRLGSVAIIVARDITERVKSEYKLRQAAAIFENTQEIILLLDSEHNVISANPAFAEITGRDLKKVIGYPIKNLRSDRHGAGFYDALWSTIQRTGSWQGELWGKRDNGTEVPFWGTINPVPNPDGEEQFYVFVMSDISKIKDTEDRLTHLTNHDPLTQLPNRLMMISVLDHAIKRATRNKAPLALILLDVDRFKAVNDTLGHKAGDLLLKAVAERLLESAPTASLVAHTSGDEFGILLENIPSSNVAKAVAQNILDAFQKPMSLGGFEVFVTLSIGISAFPEHGETSGEISRHSVSAMHKAKTEGGNRIQIYAPELTKVAFQNLQIENSLRQAIDSEQLELYYQPQFLLADGLLCGAEALVRWQHPIRGTIPPNMFIPRAEETGLIIPMGAKLLHDACNRCKTWIDAGLCIAPVAVNISGVQINNSPIVETVSYALEQSGLNPRFLKLEITESFAMKEAQESINKLHGLRNLGVELAIDDFGTGYSSLAYLRELPVTILKIDREFIKNLPDHQGDSAITKAIIAMAQSLGLQVVAEGVETESQRKFLQKIGCDIMQGYLGGRPISAAEFETTHLQTKEHYRRG